ncbi:Ring-type e3 ubiquitin transferase [Thalictrum thalictroides]|uniref:RING-type E3 ubiquitin transferase n=1 Tax=Thalictrum thalictroides TaxID=46969 RepID=A0A7J6W3B2_THATH|nr:Ring-type e3 ubiquitin transferase [Thalictrum thalictroides]
MTTTKAGFPAHHQQQQLLTKSLSDICSIPDESYSWEIPRRFSGYLKRLQLILNHFLRSPSENHSPSVQTALKGITSDLTKSSETLLLYKNKSKIYVLINCKSLCLSLQQSSISIAGWLALLDSTLLDNNPELHKKTSDLSTDLKQAQFKVTENEERVYCTLQKEGQVRQTSKAVQSAIIMDLARALGTEPENHGELEKQIKLLKNDIASSNSIVERRILMSLERIFDSWSIEPNHAAGGFDVDFEDDEQIQPFRNFICPLTKEVMKNPVVLESSQNYEKTAIKYWFERCIEDGRDPTCPVTGQVLKSLEQKPNIGLAGAIEEWVNRNVDIQIKSALQYLSEDPPQMDSMEGVLDNIYKVSEEHPSCRYKIRNAGVVFRIIRMLKNCSKSNGSNLRSKSLLVLLSMSKDEESKLKMLEEGMTKLAIRSLNIERSEKEREYAVKLLLEFSKDEAYCAKIASEKGALVLLSTMAGNLEYPTLSYLAEEVLKKVEKVEDNIQHLASAGRFEPLLSRLCEGRDDIKIEMASLVGKMDLTNTSKERIARQGAKILVDMLYKPEGRMESLQALYNLSTLDDNATILVDSGVLAPLTNILFNVEDDFNDLKELVVSIISNIVSKSGHWELASVSKEGFSLQSEAIVKRIIQLLPHASPKGQVQVLQILSGIASSPQASESVATHIASGGDVTMVLQFLGHPEAAHRLSAFKLVRILSEKVGPILATELRASNSFPLLKDKLLDTQDTDGERYEATCILANIPLTDDEVKTILGTNLIGWIVSALKEYNGSSSGKTLRSTSLLVEGLLGLLLHYAKSRDLTMFSTAQEYRLMTVFREQLSISLQPRVKQRAALGLKYLSEFGKTLNVSTDLEPKRSRGLFSSLTLCGKAPKIPPTCPIHCTACGDDSQFCLLKSNCIKPLVNLLDDEDTCVQINAVQALSTVLDDGSHSPKRAVDELEELGVVDKVIALFKDVRTGELQERTIWMVERILRLDSQNPRFSVDQTLVRALVEALKHGSANTKRHAQNALTNLKQLSGISGKISTQGQRPTNRQ